jgi:hypothetical protein
MIWVSPGCSGVPIHRTLRLSANGMGDPRSGGKITKNRRFFAIFPDEAFLHGTLKMIAFSMG